MQHDKTTFVLREFIDHFSRSPGLARSVDKIFEIVVYALFAALLKEANREVLVSVLKQFGSAGQLQRVITEEELEVWYEKALRGQSAESIGDTVLQKLANEIKVEFPSTTAVFDDFLDERCYNSIPSVDFWDF